MFDVREVLGGRVGRLAFLDRTEHTKTFLGGERLVSLFIHTEVSGERLPQGLDDGAIVTWSVDRPTSFVLALGDVIHVGGLVPEVSLDVGRHTSKGCLKLDHAVVQLSLPGWELVEMGVLREKDASNLMLEDSLHEAKSNLVIVDWLHENVGHDVRKSRLVPSIRWHTEESLVIQFPVLLIALPRGLLLCFVVRAFLRLYIKEAE